MTERKQKQARTQIHIYCVFLYLILSLVIVVFCACFYLSVLFILAELVARTYISLNIKMVNLQSLNLLLESMQGTKCFGYLTLSVPVIKTSLRQYW